MSVILIQIEELDKILDKVCSEILFTRLTEDWFLYSEDMDDAIISEYGALNILQTGVTDYLNIPSFMADQKDLEDKSLLPLYLVIKLVIKNIQSHVLISDIKSVEFPQLNKYSDNNLHVDRFDDRIFITLR